MDELFDTSPREFDWGPDRSVHRVRDGFGNDRVRCLVPWIAITVGLSVLVTGVLMALASSGG